MRMPDHLVADLQPSFREGLDYAYGHFPLLTIWQILVG